MDEGERQWSLHPTERVAHTDARAYEKKNGQAISVFLVLAMAWTIAALSGWGVASWAVNVDNRVGNDRYDVRCTNGTAGSVAGPVCRTDNATLTYYMDSSGAYELEAPDRAHVKWILKNRYDPTDLNVFYDATPTFSGSAETDIIFQEGMVTSGYAGATWCDDSSPSGRYVCDQQYVRIRGNGTYSRALVCHETGHAVGLVHGTNSNPETSNSDSDLGCLRNPPPTGGLGANQKNRINQMY